MLMMETPTFGEQYEGCAAIYGHRKHRPRAPRAESYWRDCPAWAHDAVIAERWAGASRHVPQFAALKTRSVRQLDEISSSGG